MPCTSDEISNAIDRWAGPFRFWLMRRCESPDDGVQEVFCRLVQQSRMPDRPSAWLFQVAANWVREEARKSKRRNIREQLASVQEATDASPSALMEAADLRSAVDALPSDYREIVVLRIWGELTLAEIASLLGVSIATVHRRYEHALNLLRTRWQTNQ